MKQITQIFFGRWESEFKSRHQQSSTASEAAIGGVLWKKLFLKISQHSQENICVGDSF